MLGDARRTFGVAMDNRRAIPGYKRYVDPATGAAPPVHVAFLDLVDAPGDELAGHLIAVDAAQLAWLDARERNYERIDVTARMTSRNDRSLAPVFAYRGRPDARHRFTRARARGDVVVVRDYLEAAGAAAGGLPVAELERVWL